MGLIKPTPQPPVPGERAVGGLHVVAQGVIGLTVLAMLGILWGWLMSLLARHLARDVPGDDEWQSAACQAHRRWHGAQRMAPEKGSPDLDQNPHDRGRGHAR